MAGWIKRPFSGVSRVALALAMFVAGMGAGMGLLTATAQDEGEQIFACVNLNSGGVTIVDEGTACKGNEEALVWNVTGPQGPPGEPPDEFSWSAITDIPTDITDRRAADVDCVECVDTADIAIDAVTTSRLDDLSVTTEKLDDEAVNADKLADGSVSGGPSGTIADNTITTDDLADDSVTADEIADDAVAGGLDGAIEDGTITADDLASNSVGADEIADDAVSGGPDGAIVDNSITADDLATDSVTGDAIADGTVTGADVEDHSLSTLELDANFSLALPGSATLLASEDGTTAQSVAQLMITIPGSESHYVLINGYVQINGPFSEDAVDTVGWYVTDNSAPLNTMYEQSVLPGTASTLLPVSFATTLAPGEHTLNLMVAYISTEGFGPGLVNAVNANFSVTDLGGAN